MRIVGRFLVAVLLVTAILALVKTDNVIRVEAAGTTVYADPATVDLQPGMVFNVDISVSNVEYLWAWQAGIQWDPAKVQYVRFDSGDLRYYFGERAQLFSSPEVDVVAGRFSQIPGQTIFQRKPPVGEPFTGVTASNVVLFTVTFEANGTGTTEFDPTDVQLRSRDPVNTVAYPRWSDVWANGIIDILDVIRVTSACHQYNQSADFNDDGVVDLTDMAIVSSDFSKESGDPLWGVTNIISVIPATYDEPGSLVVSPSAYYASEPGEEFNVDVRIYVGYLLTACSFKLGYNSSLLNCTGTSPGDFFPLPPRSNFSVSVDNDNGVVSAEVGLQPEEDAVCGVGRLLTVSFEAIHSATIFPEMLSCPLHLYDIHMNGTGDPPEELPIGPSVDGLFTSAVLVQDVYLTEVTFSESAVQKGDSMLINVTVAGSLFNDATVDVTAYADTFPIETQTIQLVNGTCVTFAFTFDTNQVSFGRFSICARVSTVYAEANTSNNFLTNGTILVAPVLHDLAITGVQFSKDALYAGDIVEIHVKAQNMGVFSEIFNVTVYADTNVEGIGDEITIGTKLASLPPAGALFCSATLNFTWDTNEVAAGNYTISGFASLLMDEADVTNNLFEGEQIQLFAPVPCNDLNITCPTNLVLNPSLFDFDYNYHARIVNIGNVSVKSTGYDGLLRIVGSRNGTVHLCVGQPGNDVYYFNLPLYGEVQIPLWLMFQPETHWEEYNGNFTLQLTVCGTHRLQLQIVGISITVCQNGAYIVNSGTVSFSWNLTGGSLVYLQAETNLPTGWSYTVDPPIGAMFETPHIVTVNITAPPDAKEGDLGSVTLMAYKNSTGSMIWQFIYFASTDNKAPTIETIEKPKLTQTRDLLFNATIRDASGIGNVKLFYSINGGEWTNQTMEWSSGDTFNSTSYVVPVQHLPSNSSIQYYLVATDWFGNQTQSSLQEMALNYDLAVTGVATDKGIIGGGYGTRVNVTVANQGTTPVESARLFFYVNSSIVNVETIPYLADGTSATFSYYWNTTGFGLGNCTISAYVLPLLDETDKNDNFASAGRVYVGIKGDVNGDSNVNIFDAIILSGAYNSKPGDLRWKPNADINGDNIVNILDAIILSNHYSQHYP